MFWRFGGYSNISTLDSILDKPDVSLEDLLEESDLIQELKQQNSKLLEFLRREDILKKLLHLVVADKPRLEDVDLSDAETASDARTDTSERSFESTLKPDSAKRQPKIAFFGRSRSRSKSVNKRDADSEEEKQDAQRKKRAYVACEILSSEVWSITEALLESTSDLRDFWEYLRRPAPLDPIQAGYFSKINETLLDKKTEAMFNFLRSLDGIIPEMLNHVDCPMVMDLLLKIISLEKHEGGQGIVDWLQAQGLIPILLSYLSPDNPIPTQTSAGDFLKAIITISANATGQDQTVIGPNELTRQLVSEKCIVKLIEDMLHGGNPLTVGVGIVIEVIRKNNSDYDLDNQVGPEPRTTDPIYLGVLLREFARNLPAFMSLIRDSSSEKPALKAAFGEKIQPLGFDRFKTCELMAELLHCSNMGLLNERGSDAEMRNRDAEREKLKAEGTLTPAPAANNEAEEAFASSVDSHGFHHARAPEEDQHDLPERASRLEIQNASDEDGFEKVVVPETEALPDEVTFDDLNEKLDEMSSPPFNLTQSPEMISPKSPNLPDSLSVSKDAKDTRRVSLLTQQIQDQIDETGHSSPILDQEMEDVGGQPSLAHTIAASPEDKPQPLFSGRSSPTKTAEPIDPTESAAGEEPHTPEDAEAGTHSIATLHPEATANEENPEGGLYEADSDGSPVVGDYLKIQFVQQHVVPTILDFFFRFPWNNFLHNVVYDVVQQVFNGSLERGYNRTLAQDLFLTTDCESLHSKASITQRILDGQTRSDKSQQEKGMRLGYMGHLTLIAEEVCKFTERHQPEMLGEAVLERIMAPEWVAYVEGILTETRDRDNAILGGVRPEQTAGMRAAGGASQMTPSNFDGSGAPSPALVSAGLGVPADSLALHDSSSAPTYEASGSGGAGLLSGFGEGEDEDDELDEAELQQRQQQHKAVEDDEQPSAPKSQEDPSDPSDPPATTASQQQQPQVRALPPPLNIPPSRARRQLAARLALRRRESEAATVGTDQDSPSSSSSGVRSGAGAGMDRVGGAGVMGGLELGSGFDDEEGEGGRSTDEEEEEGKEEEDEREEREGEEEERAGPRLHRRPSTVEAKVRTPIEGSDSEDETPQEEGGSSEEDSDEEGEMVEIGARRR